MKGRAVFFPKSGGGSITRRDVKRPSEQIQLTNRYCHGGVEDACLSNLGIFL